MDNHTEKHISPASPLIIAEAGVNHNGSFERACRMIDAAAEAGADYVKFQTFRAASLVSAGAATADYQKSACSATSQLEMLSGLELSFPMFRQLAILCREKGIGFLSTPFDRESVDFLAGLAREGLMDYMKVPSGEITNLPYLRAVASTSIPVIMSSGMSTLADIESALAVFYDAGYAPSSITLLHCNTEYPTPFTDVNLRAMNILREAFGLSVGYSDHTRGISVPLAATALGASVIEKHFTLSRTLPGPDHAASLEPDELKAMVSGIREVAQALGSPVKRISDSERKNMTAARKSIVASRPISKGEILSESALAVKRPGSGLSPMLWDSVIGRTAAKDFSTDEMITL